MTTLVVGAGHNGLVCACYLARAGIDVLVLEQSAKPGGGSRTEATVAGYCFDTHSVAHNILNMTSIPRELGLRAAGLEYREMDPFATAVFADGRRVRFHRSIERTVASIARIDRDEARAYEQLMDDATALVDLLTLALRAGGGARAMTGRVLRRLPQARRLVGGGGARRLTSELPGSYGELLRRRLGSDLTRGPVGAFAAHAGASPEQPGGALFGFWQAAYHRYGQWHAVGGAQGLTDALVRRLAQLGGRVRCDALVTRIDAAGGRVRAVELAGGERLAADRIVTAIDPRAALLELMDPPLDGTLASELAATHRSNGVQLVVHVAVDRLPAYTSALPGDHDGLQSYVDELGELTTAFAAAEERRVHLPAPAYAFTPSALDDALAPPGHHTVYLACPTAPFDVRDGWERAAPAVVESMLDQVEARAPGFQQTIQGIAVRTPEDMASELRWPGAHPMVLDVTLDQLGLLRPTAALASHRTPIDGMYISGAGTAPTGGIAGLPGRGAAQAVLRDRGRRRG